MSHAQAGQLDCSLFHFYFIMLTLTLLIILIDVHVGLKIYCH